MARPHRQLIFNHASCDMFHAWSPLPYTSISAVSWRDIPAIHIGSTARAAGPAGYQSNFEKCRDGGRRARLRLASAMRAEGNEYISAAPCWDLIIFSRGLGRPPK